MAHLPRNATQAILFHPTMLNCPHLKSEKVKAIISQLAALYSTTDKMIHEIHFELSNPNFVKSLHIFKEAVDLIHSAKSSIADLPQAKHLSKSTRTIIKQASIY